MNRTLMNTLVVGGALGASVLAVQQTTHLLPGSARQFDTVRERCYGVARAGHNDCGTAHHACAQQSTADAAPDEWLMVPAGLCERIRGGRRG